MLKLNKLSAALKNKSIIRWVRKEGNDFILTDYFVFKTPNLGNSISQLVKLFGCIPNEGEGISLRVGEVNQLSENEVRSTLDFLNYDYRNRIEYTHMIYNLKDISFNVFKGSSDYIYINSEYLNMVDLFGSDIEICGTDKISPVFFISEFEQFMVLPTRFPNQPKYIK